MEKFKNLCGQIPEELHNKVRNVVITAVEGESLLGRIRED